MRRSSKVCWIERDGEVSLSSPSRRSAVACASAVAAAAAGRMTVRAGFAAVMFAVFDDVMALGDVAFAIGAGAFGSVRVFHDTNT